MRQITNISKIIVVVIVTALIIWFGMQTVKTAENLERAQQSRAAKIDSILDRK